jgi:hypothetical protein
LTPERESTQSKVAEEEGEVDKLTSNDGGLASAL